MSMSKARNIMAAVAVLSLFSCIKEIGGQEDRSVTFSVMVEDLAQLEDTKSVLSGDDIETKITSLTLGLYCNGSIKDRLYFGPGGDKTIGDFASYSIDLALYLGCEVVALANMGDMRSSLPVKTSGLSSVSYRIPGYTSPSGTCIQARGLPMAGRIRLSEEDTFVSDVLDGTTVQLPLRRLLAKVAVDLSVHWPGYIQSVKIRNLNAVMRPFAQGGSAAASVTDILAEEEIDTGTDAKEGTFVFYVPENRQGSVDGITASSDKSADNNILTGRTSVLTYMEVLVEGKGDGVDKEETVGSMTYRSYLGDNATSNFDIIGNHRYTWRVSYRMDGLTLQDWKHENALAWFMPRYWAYPDIATLTWTASTTINLYKSYDTYENGSLVSRIRNEDDFYLDMALHRDEYSITGCKYYYYADPEDDSVRNDSEVVSVEENVYTNYSTYTVTGEYEGRRVFHFFHDDVYGLHRTTSDIRVLGYRYDNSITPASSSTTEGRPVTLTAVVRKEFADGGALTLQDTQPGHYYWSCYKEDNNGNYRSYSNFSNEYTKSNNTVTYTPVSEGRYRIGFSYLGDEDYIPNVNRYAYVTVTSGWHLELVASPSSAEVGSSIQLKLYAVDTGGTRTDVTSLVGASGWTRLTADGSASNSRISIVSSTGVATASDATSGIIRASYNGQTSNDVAVEWKLTPTLSVSPSSLTWEHSQKCVSKCAYVSTNVRSDITLEVSGADASDLYYKLNSSAETSGSYAGKYKLTTYFRTVNSSATAKNATITFRAGNQTATVTCTQDGVETLLLSPAELEWGWDETSTKTSTITTNLSGLYIFKGGDAASAITASRSGNTVSVSWTGSNTASTERTATVTVANASTIAAATATAVLTVRQAGHASLSVSPSSLSWPYNEYGSGNAKTAKVTTNIPLASLTATVSGDNASQVSCALQSSGTAGVYDLVAYFKSANSGSAARNATVTISATGDYSSAGSVTVTLSQAYNSYITLGSELLTWQYNESGQTKSKTTKVRTSVPRSRLTVSTGSSNVGYSLASTANSDGTYTLTLWWTGTNSSTSKREAVVTVYDTDDSGVSDTLTVRQEGRPSTVDLDDDWDDDGSEIDL